MLPPGRVDPPGKVDPPGRVDPPGCVEPPGSVVPPKGVDPAGVALLLPGGVDPLGAAVLPGRVVGGVPTGWLVGLPGFTVVPPGATVEELGHLLPALEDPELH